MQSSVLIVFHSKHLVITAPCFLGKLLVAHGYLHHSDERADGKSAAVGEEESNGAAEQQTAAQDAVEGATGNKAIK